MKKFFTITLIVLTLTVLMALAVQAGTLREVQINNAVSVVQTGPDSFSTKSPTRTIEMIAPADSFFFENLGHVYLKTPEGTHEVIPQSPACQMMISSPQRLSCDWTHDQELHADIYVWRFGGVMFQTVVFFDNGSWGVIFEDGSSVFFPL